MKSYVNWLIEHTQDDNLCDPPLDAQEGLNFLCHYLLGENWYAVMSESTEQVNSVVVHEILCKYSRKYKKEIARHRLKKKPEH